VISLAITSQKGGVGKTTVSVNLAYSFAKRGWRTLLVDTDPQGSVGLSLSEKARKCPGFFNAFQPGQDLNRLVLTTRLPSLSILPAGQVENVFEVKPNGVDGVAGVTQLLEMARAQGFQLVLIDTPAGLTGYTSDILRCVNYALVPQQAEPLGVRSLPQMLQALQAIRQRQGGAARTA
jgi:chromosome partitioning protein